MQQEGTSRPPRAQARLHKPHKQTGIPRPFGPSSLTVTDGSTCIGCITEHEGSHFAHTPDGVLVGEYKARQQAMAALPNADSLCVSDHGTTGAVS